MGVHIKVVATANRVTLIVRGVNHIETLTLLVKDGMDIAADVGDETVVTTFTGGGNGKIGGVATPTFTEPRSMYEDNDE